jgi:alkanesulfonate monooxygenase
LAEKHADCLWRLPDTPEVLAPKVAAARTKGIEVGLLVSLIARHTHNEAVSAAYSMIENLGEKPRQTHKDFSARSDSVAFKSVLQMAETQTSHWLTPYLWTGAVPYLGAPAIALVGSAEEIAAAIMKYKQAGITQFLFMGWPDLEEMSFFSREVVPLVRRQEQREALAFASPVA